MPTKALLYVAEVAYMVTEARAIVGLARRENFHFDFAKASWRGKMRMIKDFADYPRPTTEQREI